MSTHEAVVLLAVEAESAGGTSDDGAGIVRAVVESHGLGFYAWFCACCELGDREAQRQGYPSQVARAAAMMEVSPCAR